MPARLFSTPAGISFDPSAEGAAFLTAQKLKGGSVRVWGRGVLGLFRDGQCLLRLRFGLLLEAHEGVEGVLVKRRDVERIGLRYFGCSWVISDDQIVCFGTDGRGDSATS